MRQLFPNARNSVLMIGIAYKQSDDADEECKVNEAMLERAVQAVEHLSPKMTYVVLPSGSKVALPLSHLPRMLLT